MMESRCEIRRELVLPLAPCENDVRMRYNVRLSLDFRTVPNIGLGGGKYGVEWKREL